MAGFGGGLMQGALLCGATLAALSLALPQPSSVESIQPEAQRDVMSPEVPGKVAPAAAGQGRPVKLSDVPPADGVGALTVGLAKDGAEQGGGVSTAPALVQDADQPDNDNFADPNPAPQLAIPVPIGPSADRMPSAPGNLAANPPRPGAGLPLPAPRAEALPHQADAPDARPAPSGGQPQPGLAAAATDPSMPQMPLADSLNSGRRAEARPPSAPAAERDPEPATPAEPQPTDQIVVTSAPARPAAEKPSVAQEAPAATDNPPAAAGLADESQPMLQDFAVSADAARPTASTLRKTYPAPDLALPPDLSTLLATRQTP